MPEGVEAAQRYEFARPALAPAATEDGLWRGGIPTAEQSVPPPSGGHTVPAFPQPTGPPPPGSRRRLTPAVRTIGLVVVILALASAGVFVYRSKTSATTGPTPASQPTATGIESPTVPPLPSEEPTADTPTSTSSELTGADQETQALTELQQQRDTDIGRVHLRGQWVAQLASKWVGATDPLQVNAAGSHRFDAVDILAEHQSLQNRLGSSVILLLGTDYGQRQTGPSGQPLWVTFFLGPFSNEQAVESWCAEQFSDLSGAQLANACTARRLRPPG